MLLLSILTILLPTSLAFPLGVSSSISTSGASSSISTSVLDPLSNLGELSNQKFAAIAQAKTSLLGIPSFPDSGRKNAVLETESLTSQLDSKYTNAQQFVANILHPKPIVDTIQEHEKYGNDGDKLRSVGTLVVGAFEGFSNAINAAVDLPFVKLKQVGKQITDSLNAVGGKLVGL